MFFRTSGKRADTSFPKVMAIMVFWIDSFLQYNQHHTPPSHTTSRQGFITAYRSYAYWELPSKSASSSPFTRPWVERLHTQDQLATQTSLLSWGPQRPPGSCSSPSQPLTTISDDSAARPQRIRQQSSEETARSTSVVCGLRGMSGRELQGQRGRCDVE